MEVTELCVLCYTRFDAHWHLMESPKCPKCGNVDRQKLVLSTDELDSDYE